MEFGGDTATLDARSLRRDEDGRNRNACLVVISGGDIGRLYQLTDHPLTLGRDPGSEITIEDDAVSRNHACFQRSDDDRFSVRDLGSRNGTFCNGDRVTERLLEDGDRILVGTSTVLKFTYHDSLEITFQEYLFSSAVRDWLTQCFNRRYFNRHLATECKFASRHNTSLSVVLFDIDHFKRVNDTHGHLAGDLVLKGVGAEISKTLRQEEVLARYGGEEFAVVARNTALEGARILAERCRACVEGTSFDFKGEVISVTISAGVSTFDSSRTASPEDMVARADAALYKAKNKGRNRVELEKQ